MVLVKGLDRLDDNKYLSGMSDELWSEHSKELQSAFEERIKEDPNIGFTEFCAPFAEGTAATKAMEKYADQQTPKTYWPGVLGQRGDEAVNVIKSQREDLEQVVAIPDGSMMTMDYREDRVRIFVDSSGKVARIPHCG